MSDKGILLSPTIESLALITTPYLTYYAGAGSFLKPSTKGNAMGSGTTKFVRYLPCYRCVSSFVLWLRKIPLSLKFSDCIM